MSKTPRSTAGNRYKDVSAVTGRKHGETVQTPTEVQTQYLRALLRDTEDEDVVSSSPYQPRIDTQPQNCGPSKQIHTAPSQHTSPTLQSHHETTTSSNRTVHAEIDNLKAICEDLELQLAKAKLEKRQAKLQSDLSTELQPGDNTYPAECPTGTLNKSLVKKSKQIVDFFFHP